MSSLFLSQNYIHLRRFFRHRAAVASLFILTCLCLLSILAPEIENYLGIDSEKTDLFNRLAPASAKHIMGTDELGRDVFIRLLYGGRISLMIGLVTSIMAAIIGIFIGIMAGFYKGWIDIILMRLTDGVIALPLLPLLIIMAAIDLEKLGLPPEWIANNNISLYRLVFIITLFGWTTVAKLVRAGALNVMDQGYVQASRAFGVGNVRIMMQHVLPNISGSIIVAVTLSIGGIILLESVLSFLGLGIQPPIASWGNMLTNAQDLIWEYPLLAFYPGFCIFMTVICFNFIGDGVQDALNPKAIIS